MTWTDVQHFAEWLLFFLFLHHSVLAVLIHPFNTCHFLTIEL